MALETVEMSNLAKTLALKVLHKEQPDAGGKDDYGVETYSTRSQIICSGNEGGGMGGDYLPAGNTVARTSRFLHVV